MPDQRIARLLKADEKQVGQYRHAYEWSKANPLSAKTQEAVFQFVPKAAQTFRLNGPKERRQPPGKAGSPGLVVSSAAP